MQTSTALLTPAAPAVHARGAVGVIAGWLVPSIAHLILLGCILATMRVGSLMVSADGDPARHITVGQHILDAGTLLRHDVFSHTMVGESFVPFEWLAEVGAALAYRVAGLGGVALLHGSVIGLTFALVYGHLRRLGHPVLLALAVTLAIAAASAVHWLARPHVFTFLGTAVFALALDGWRRGTYSRTRLWALPVAMVLWVNTHGGFLIGLILLGVYLVADAGVQLIASGDAAADARRRLKQLIPVSVATAAATLLNPDGFGLFGHVTGYFGKKLLVSRTVEYMSPDFHSPDTYAFLALLLAFGVCLGWSRRRLQLHEALIALGFTYFALHSVRNVPLFAIVIAPVLASQVASLRSPLASGSPLAPLAARVAAWIDRRNEVYARIEARCRGHLLPALAIGALVFAGASQAQTGESTLGVRFDPLRQPVGAAAFLREHPIEGRMFNELRWGGFLLHSLWPAQPVFIDGQTDFYGEALTREWLDAVELKRNWYAVLERHEIRWVIFDTDSAFVRALAEKPDWRVVYQDETATVLARGGEHTR